MIIEFDRHHACAFGVTEAAVIGVLRGLIAEARETGEDIREGRTYLCMTASDLASATGFLTEQQARAVFGSLLFQRVIVTAPARANSPLRSMTFGFFDEARFMTGAAPAPKLKRVGKTMSKRALVALGIDEQHAADWLTARKAKRLPLTTTAWEGVVREAEKAGLTPAQAVEIAAQVGWAGFKASWIEQETAKAGGAWWTNDGLMLAKAMQVGVGPALAGESRDAWKARINAAIDNGGTPPAPRPVPVTPVDPVPSAPSADAHARAQPSAASRAAFAGAKELLKSKGFGGTAAAQPGENA